MDVRRMPSVALCLTFAAFLPAARAQTFDGTDVARFDSKSTPPVIPARLAVVVGIDEYAYAHALRYPAKDAVDVGRALHAAGWLVNIMVPAKWAQEVGKGDQSLRVGPAPWTAASILSEVKSMAQQADPPDTILFYFSGHGGSDAAGRNLLCPYDSSGDLRTVLYVGAVLEEMMKSKAQRRLMILDACRGSQGARATNPAGFSEMDMARGEATGILFGTAPGYVSWDTPSDLDADHNGVPMRNGVFTHVVLQGLAGNADCVCTDGYVTFRELSYYVGAEMKKLCAYYPTLKQKPFFYWDGGAQDDVLLAKVQNSQAVPSRTSAEPTGLPPLSEPDRAAGVDSDSGLPRTVVHRTLGTRLVLIRPSTGTCGAADADADASADEKPRHTVVLSRPFYVSACEISNRELRMQLPSHRSLAADGSTALDGDDLPAVNVSWVQAKAFCDQYGFRLPTEAEWEVICRAGSDDSRYGELDEIAWTSVNSGGVTHRVGTKAPNAWNVFDQIGNAGEWCGDWYSPDYYRTIAEGARDPKGPERGERRVVRRSSYAHGPKDGRASKRDGQLPGYRSPTIGFRVVLDVADATVAAAAPAGANKAPIPGSILFGAGAIDGEHETSLRVAPPAEVIDARNVTIHMALPEVGSHWHEESVARTSTWLEPIGQKGLETNPQKGVVEVETARDIELRGAADGAPAAVAIRFDRSRKILSRRDRSQSIQAVTAGHEYVLVKDAKSGEWGVELHDGAEAPADEGDGVMMSESPVVVAAPPWKFLADRDLHPGQELPLDDPATIAALVGATLLESLKPEKATLTYLGRSSEDSIDCAAFRCDAMFVVARRMPGSSRSQDVQCHAVGDVRFSIAEGQLVRRRLVIDRRMEPGSEADLAVAVIEHQELVSAWRSVR